MSIAECIREGWKQVPTEDRTLQLDIAPDVTVEATEQRLEFRFERLFEFIVRYTHERIAIRIGTLQDGFVVVVEGLDVDLRNHQPKHGREAVSDEGSVESELAVMLRGLADEEREITVLDGVDGGTEFIIAV